MDELIKEFKSDIIALMRYAGIFDYSRHSMEHFIINNTELSNLLSTYQEDL